MVLANKFLDLFHNHPRKTNCQKRDINKIKLKNCLFRIPIKLHEVCGAWPPTLQANKRR